MQDTISLHALLPFNHYIQHFNVSFVNTVKENIIVLEFFIKEKTVIEIVINFHGHLNITVWCVRYLLVPDHVLREF